MLKPVAPLLALLALSGCDPRECWMGISHGDCGVAGTSLAAFPQDDAICRDYGLTPGTKDYAVCRAKKAHVRALTEQSTDIGVLQNPVLPNLR